MIAIGKGEEKKDNSPLTLERREVEEAKVVATNPTTMYHQQMRQRYLHLL